MDDLSFLAPLLQNLGSAGTAFGLMYLWLRDAQARARLAEERADEIQARIDLLHQGRAQEQATQIALLQQALQTRRGQSSQTLPE